ncbi:MAG: beta-N-acetylhexosaminidase [Clostridiales bacterium]|nr:beta-N-acetylhexosaminidase [Clostridiales bacterium]
MKLFFDVKDEVLKGIMELSDELEFQISSEKEADVIVEVLQTQEQVVNVKLQHNHATITYGGGLTRFFRGLSLLIEALNDGKTTFLAKETPCFDSNGTMLDVSRNTVMRPNVIKYMIRRMALMGLNTLMLYTEDTYEIPSRPYFGYARGRYTKEEIKDIDSYALLFGIELIPCVQFLGHLATALRWNCTAPYRDTGNILLVGAEETYDFIEDILKTLNVCFTSRRLHMGMDEAHALGLGQYLEKNGYRDQTDIFIEHLHKITDLAKTYGFKPMMWSDMFFRMLTTKKVDYDADVVFSKEISDKIPEGIQQIFWDYYHDNKDFYTTIIDKHKDLGENTIFAGGIWLWIGGVPVYQRTLDNTLPALSACKEKNIKEVIATVWHNGAESNLILSLAGLQIYAEYDYSGEYDEEKVAKRFKACCKANYEDFLVLDAAEHPEGDLTNPNATRYLLYNDPLIGLVDKHAENLNIGDFYKGLSNDFSNRGPKEGIIKPAFDVVRKLVSVLELKSDYGVRLKQAYDRKDNAVLKEMAEESLELMKRIDDLRLCHRDAWMLYNKPFGWEVLDARYGILNTRFSTARDRILDYLSGNISTIEELEMERLWYDCRADDEDKPAFIMGSWGNFKDIYTAGIL